MRRIAYITGTRADFGLMESVLTRLESGAEFELGVVVTGAHLDAAFGHTVDHVRGAGYRIIGEIPTVMEPRTGLTVATAAGTQLSAMAQCLDTWRPDIVLVLGDRPEMLAGTIAATLLGQVVVHIHGGERSGSIDESIRHAISKLAHYHFVATEHSAERLTKMGERPDHIHCVGAPGLDGIVDSAVHTKDEICNAFSIDPSKPLGVAVYHPVTHEQGALGEQVGAVARAMLDAGLEILLFRPNSDAGGDEIDAALATFRDSPGFHVVTHLDRARYLSVLRHADIMVGNSSSGIIEAASFGLGVVDVGSRQNYRERGKNVLTAEADTASIRAAIDNMLGSSFDDCDNIYGDGQASERITGLLSSLEIEPIVLAKVNVY